MLTGGVRTLFAGIILKQNEVRWGTLIDGRYYSFSSSICPGKLDHVLSDPKAARTLIASIVDEIQRQCQMKPDLLVIATTTTGIRELAVLDDALDAACAFHYMMKMSTAAAYGVNCQMNQHDNEQLLIMCADRERYDLCTIDVGDGICEICACTQQRVTSFSSDDILQSVFQIIEETQGKNLDRAFLSQSVPEPVFRSIQKRLHMPCKRFGDDLCLYGVTMKAACYAGVCNGFLLLDIIDWWITAGTIKLITANTTCPYTAVYKQIPRAAIRNGSVVFSLISDSNREDPISIKLPLGNVPPVSRQGKTPDVTIYAEHHWKLSVELTSEGKTKHFAWPEIREQIIQSIPKSKPQFVKQKTPSPEPVKNRQGLKKPEQSTRKKSAVSPMKPDDRGRYVFISYAHKNSDIVLPIIRRLQDDGFRVWYDDGIHPGTEWPEIIASHVERCAFFLPFLTKEYLESENCKRELHFAGEINKPRSLIFLEKVQLTSGIRMQHGLSHSLIAYSYQSIEDLYPRLYESEEILSTRK